MENYKVVQGFFSEEAFALALLHSKNIASIHQNTVSSIMKCLVSKKFKEQYKIK
jgi:hypothetical protein